MKGSLKRMYLKATANMNGLMEGYIMVLGEQERWMGKEHSLGAMGALTMEITSRTSNMAMECLLGLTGKNMMGSGALERWTGSPQ